MSPFYRHPHTKAKSRLKRILWFLAALAIFCFVVLLFCLRRVMREEKLPARSSPASPTVSPDAKQLAGKWHGATRSPDGARCRIDMDLRQQSEGLEQFTGYARVTCLPVNIFALQPTSSVVVMRHARMPPTSAILSGTGQKDGGIRLVVYELIGPPQNRMACMLPSFAITPVGWNAVSYPDGCRGGRVFLQRDES